MHLPLIYLKQVYSDSNIALQVFSRANIWFSQDGEYYEDEPIAYSYIPDIVLENARNVTIGLRGRQGKFLKFHLYFAARWIMIGEIMFDKCKFHENVHGFFS